MIFSYPNFEIDLYHREVQYNKKLVKLTDLEIRILLYLASQPGHVFTYQQINEGVWGEEYAHEKGIIMSHIRHIRQNSPFQYIFMSLSSYKTSKDERFMIDCTGLK